MKKYLSIVVPIVLAAILLAVAGISAFDRPDDAIRYRQAMMTLIGHHFGCLGDVLKGKEPYDAEAFAAETTVVLNLSLLPWEAFLLAGSDKGATDLKPSALSQPEAFQEAARAFQGEMVRLSEAAAAGDFDGIKSSRFGAVVRSCKDCHSRFRSR
jgi:cytochrome c556